MSSTESHFSLDVLYQKVYNVISDMPIIRRYVYKIRRRLEILNNEDEYIVRKQTTKIAIKGIIITILASLFLVIINREQLFMMIVSLTGVLVVLENLTDMMVNSIEDKLIKQQLELFSEVRHSFHETNMIEEAIYDASLLEDYEVTLQAERIYDIMISNDPEIELEKYYDVAPNRFLKAFAGISYLTKEFGDRKVNDVSLYLKNLNNITQELQMEILKRDKLDYLFKSLTFIALGPILLILPLRNWAVNTFESTRDFYYGKFGFILQIVTLVLIFISYALLKRVKENNDRIKVESVKENPIQERIYRIPFIEKFIDNLMPNVSKKEYVRIRNLLKDTNSPYKMEWLYVNRIIYAIVAFFAMIFLLNQLHTISINTVLYGATMEQKVLGQATEKEKAAAADLTSFDRYFINSLVRDNEIVKSVREESKEVAIKKIEQAMIIINNTPPDFNETRKKATTIYNALKDNNLLVNSSKSKLEIIIREANIEIPDNKFPNKLANIIIDNLKITGRKEIGISDIENAIIQISKVPQTSEQISQNASRIYDKLNILTSEYIKATEVFIALLISYFAYYIPIYVLKFQRKMRAMEMEDEVMQFQTIILMLMHIERVSVEYMLEWIERFACIFKEPLATCLNNYESGAWQALEQLKEDAPFKPFVRLVDSFQSAVENIPIKDAFDELETERNFFQERRKETNERLISRKARIGRLLGFAPMVTLFVGYLIIPLLWVSVKDMSSYFSQMSVVF
jgi:hypothetical protein